MFDPGIIVLHIFCSLFAIPPDLVRGQEVTPKSWDLLILEQR